MIYFMLSKMSEFVLFESRFICVVILVYIEFKVFSHYPFIVGSICGNALDLFPMIIINCVFSLFFLFPFI